MAGGNKRTRQIRKKLVQAKRDLAHALKTGEGLDYCRRRVAEIAAKLEAHKALVAGREDEAND